MRKTHRYLILILLLAFALRLFRLGEQSLWYDEGVSWYLTQFSLSELIRWTAADIQPPFYYLILWAAVRLFGASEFALRFPSVIFGVLTVPVIWQIANGRMANGRMGEWRMANGEWANSAPRTTTQSKTHYSLFAILSSLFVAFAPLMVYYSQEARMYTLLVFQAALGSYLFLQLTGRAAKKHTAIAYVLVMASALYTHYFSVFLLLAHFIYNISIAFSAGLRFTKDERRKTKDERRTTSRNLTLKTQDQDPEPRTPNPQPHYLLFTIHYSLFIAIAVLFVPWLPVLLSRLGDDPSYWPGALKLSEAVQDVFISFAVGGKREMIFEADGLALAIGFAVLLLISLILLLRASFTIHHSPFTIRHSSLRFRSKQAFILHPFGKLRASLSSFILFLLLWLVIPVASILLLSWQTPKFNPRYVMISWPAFALILSAGLTLMDKCTIRHSSFVLRHSSLVMVLLFIVFSWGFSLRNWFFVPEFSKDDFKHVAQFIRERYTPGDTVLLSSGHFFPVWQYYFGAENWTPLPKMETLDVKHVTNFSITPQLERALRGKSGAWLVQWQDEVVDPNGVIPLLLDSSARRVEDEFHYGNFWGVKLAYWQLPANLEFPADFPATQRAEFNFGNLVTLRGWLQLPGDDAEVTLFWQARQPLMQDYQVLLRLLDDAGVEWSDGTRVVRPADYLYPTTRWTPNSVVAGRQTLPWLSGAPPGNYWLEVGWLTADGEGVDVLDANGNPQRRVVTLGPIHVTRPVGGAAVDNSMLLRVGLLELLSGSFEPPEAEAGSRVVFDAVWQVSGQRSAVDGQQESVSLAAWRDAAGARFALSPSLPIPANYPPGTVFRSRSKLTTPFEAAAGLATLLAQAGNEQVSAGQLTLLPTERNFALPPELDIQADVNFGNQTTLLGATVDTLSLSPGQSTQLTLYWRAEAPFSEDYTVFVHLLGLDGTPLVIADHAPPRPTSNWIEGEIIADPVTLTLPADTPPGVYPLEVGFYNTNNPNYPRLPLADNSADYVILAEVIAGERD